jgi:hypothetical protein
MLAAFLIVQVRTRWMGELAVGDNKAAPKATEGEGAGFSKVHCPRRLSIPTVTLEFKRDLGR